MGGKDRLHGVGAGGGLGHDVGVASVALAGTGVGAVFNLGKTNTVDAVSKLVSHAGTGPAGPMLLIDNNSTASGATGLSIQTEAGKPPMKVNQAAKVANLTRTSWTARTPLPSA